MGNAKIVSWARCLFDGKTEKDLKPLDLIAFDLWEPSCVQSAGGKSYMMIIVNGGMSYKHRVYLEDKSYATTISAFNTFCIKADTVTGRKVHKLQTNWGFESAGWEEYCQTHRIIHEFTAPYSSAQNGLAECAIRTTMDDV